MSNLTLAKLGPYQLLSLLGVGGMSEIYRAHDPRLDREVAMKVLPLDLARQPGFLERFRREAHVIAMLEHPNIMPIYDFGEENGVMYVVMPLIEGGTLRDRILKRGACTLRETASLLYQVAQALQEAHQHGLVHRDVKPANILIAPGERAVLADFGIVRALGDDRELTQEGMGIGTAEYMSPEQASGEKIDHRADIYALGIVLFQALTGRVPFTSTVPYKTAYNQVHEPPPLPRSIKPTILPAVEAVILKALAKDPAQRYQSAEAFGVALAAATPWLHLAGVQPEEKREPSQTSGISWSDWVLPPMGESMTEPLLKPKPGLQRGSDVPAGVYAAPYHSDEPAPERANTFWVVLFTMVLTVLVIGGAFAAFGGLGALKNKATNQAPPASSGLTSPPAATATPAPAVYYLAQFFALGQGDLLQGDQLGQTTSIANDQYPTFEGPKGTIYQSGDATQFGRAFGTGTIIRDQQGTLRFVVVADRFTTVDQAQQYYQHQAGLLSQSMAVTIGEQALTGLGRVEGDQASFRLVLLDRNVVVVFATPRIAAPQSFQAYFAQLAQVIDQRGHRCQFNATLKPVAGSPAMCAQA